MRTQIRKRDTLYIFNSLYIFYRKTSKSLLFVPIRNCNFSFFLSFFLSSINRGKGDRAEIQSRWMQLVSNETETDDEHDALSTFTNDEITSATPRAPRKLANKPTDYR